MPIQLISYLRFSSGDQLKGDSLDRQTTAFNAYLKACLDAGEDVEPGKVNYRDLGKSGFSGAHLAGDFGRFLDAVQKGKFARGSRLVVENFDRMSRADPLQAFKSFTAIIEAGIAIVTLSSGQVFSAEKLTLNPYDAMPAYGEMIRANSDSKRKSELSTRNWAQARAKAGEKKMTTRCPAWLRYDESSRDFVKIPDRVEIVQRIFAESAKGVGMEAIGRALNQDGKRLFVTIKKDGTAPKGSAKAWSTAYLSKILRWRAVLGEFQPMKVAKREKTGTRTSVPVGDPLPGYFPQIIDQRTWDRVQDGLNARVRYIGERTTKLADGESKTLVARTFGKGGRRGDAHSNLFTHLLRCQICQGSMVAQGAHYGRYHYLRCFNAHAGKYCTNKAYIPYKALETAILDVLDGALLDGADVQPDAQVIELQNRAAEIAAKIAANEDRAMNLAPDIFANVITRLTDETRALRDEARTVAANLQTASGRLPATDYMTAIRKMREDALGDDPETRRIARAQIADALRSLGLEIMCDINRTVHVALLDGTLQFVIEDGDVTFVMIKGENGYWSLSNDGEGMKDHGNPELHIKKGPGARLLQWMAHQRGD